MPISDLAYACGDIVVVPFPFSDRLAEKRRPALIVSGDEVAADGLFWVVMITSSPQRCGSLDLPVDVTDRSGLRVASFVRPTKITSVEASRILRSVGKMDSGKLNGVLASVRALVGSGRP